jgi:hypothetical protein
MKHQTQRPYIAPRSTFLRLTMEGILAVSSPSSSQTIEVRDAVYTNGGDTDDDYGTQFSKRWESTPWE